MSTTARVAPSSPSSSDAYGEPPGGIAPCDAAGLERVVVSLEVAAGVTAIACCDSRSLAGTFLSGASAAAVVLVARGLGGLAPRAVAPHLEFALAHRLEHLARLGPRAPHEVVRRFFASSGITSRTRLAADVDRDNHVTHVEPASAIAARRPPAR